MWTKEESAKALQIARTVRSDVKFHAIPTGLQVEKGPDAVVEYLLEVVPPLLDK
jgi:hypothetical protein